MRREENGFSRIEILVAITMVALITSAALMSMFQVLNVTKSSNDQMTAVQQVQNAGHWISRDALMAENTIIDVDPGTAEFLSFTWTEWGFEEASVYHMITYSYQGWPGVYGKLKRTHCNLTTMTSEETIVAEYIDYNNTSASYDTPLLTVQIAASFRDTSEIQKYTVWHRPVF